MQSVTDPAVVGEEEGDVVTGLPGSVEVAPDFFVVDGLLVVAQRVAGVPDPLLDDAELVLGDGLTLVVLGVVQVQRLLVAVERGVKVFQQHRLSLARGPRVVEPPQGDRAELTVAYSPTES